MDLKNIQQNTESLNWYVLFTKPKAEKKVDLELKKHGLESFLPLIKTLRQWSDRKKWITIPLFSSYVFVKLSQENYFQALNIQGVVRFVSIEKKPVPIPESQIENIRKLIGSGYEFEMEESILAEGDDIEIDSGPLKGMKGKLVSYKGRRRVVISIESLNKSLLIDIDKKIIKKR
jgi:transcription antitermination factor NusG